MKKVKMKNEKKVISCFMAFGFRCDGLWLIPVLIFFFALRRAFMPFLLLVGFLTMGKFPVQAIAYQCPKRAEIVTHHT